MKTRHLIRLTAGLLLCLGFAEISLAQDGQRYIIRPQDAFTPHDDLVIPIGVEGGRIYQDIDFPMVGGNAVGVELTPEQLERIQMNRPDFRIEEDRVVEPHAGGPGWGLDRIDQRVGLDTRYLPAFLDECVYGRPYVYICDTGVLGTHTEFASAGSRISLAGSYIPATLPRTIPAWQDPYDHGTGVASCAVGETLGAARCPVNLVSAVCYPDPGAIPGGTFASYAADVIYWALNEHNLRSLDDDPFNDASVLVFTSSTVGGPSALLDLAVHNAFQGGMAVVVSAGNQNMDAMFTSPAGAVHGMLGDVTLTVGASTMLDARWFIPMAMPMVGSNYGATVELFAPGDMVPVASSAGISVCNLNSGTSFSAGYAAGSAARLLSRNPLATPAQVKGALTNLGNVTFGPSGPFPAPAPNAIPALLYVNPTDTQCLPIRFDAFMNLYSVGSHGLLEDPEADGLVNAIEYLMGLNPLEWTPPSERPKLTIDGGEARFSFRRANFLCNSTTYEVEISEDLMSWTAVPESSIMEDDTAPCIFGAKWMVAKIPLGMGRFYVRIKVVST